MPPLALINVFARRGRTVAGVLAVGVGTALMLVLVGLEEGTLGEVADRMTGGADADMIVHEKNWNLVFDRNAPLDEAVGSRLAALDGVARVAPVVVERMHFAGHENLGGQNVYAVKGDDLEMVCGKRSLVAGRPFADEPDSLELNIDSRLAKAGGFNVGDSVEAWGKTFTIAGIFEDGPPVRVLVSMAALRKHFIKENRVSFFFLKCSPETAKHDVAAEIERRFGRALSTVMLTDYSKVLNRSFRVITDFVSLSTVIVLVASFLTVFLAMYTAVIERIREIGVLKALGASKLYIVHEIVVESLVICVLGALVGVAFATVARAAVEMRYPLMTMHLSVRWILTAVGTALAGGILGAVYPAQRAARLDPQEALSYI